MMKVGVYSITGCAGCMLSLVFNESDFLELCGKVDVAAFPLVKGREETQKFDVLLVEGVVVHKKDLEVLRGLRERTKYLVALGACACTGGVPAYRNFVPYSNYKHLVHKKEKDIEDLAPRPIDDYVSVDYYLPGCPPDKAEILRFFKDTVLEKKPRPCTDPVCVECRLNGNFCLLERDKPCLGPVTRGGCNSICTNGGLECWGCRGRTADANPEAMDTLLKSRGFSQAFLRDRMRTFVGMKLKGAT